MEKAKSFDEATAEAKQEMTNTLYQVATMRAHFELLKNVILSKMSLDYYGKDLRLEDSALLTEVMWLIAPEAMDEILEHEQEKARVKAKMEKKKKNNG